LGTCGKEGEVSEVGIIDQALLADFGLRASILTLVLVCHRRADGKQIREQLYESWRSSVVAGYQQELSELREESKEHPFPAALAPKDVEIEKAFMDAFDRVSGIIEKIYEGADEFSKNES
jgi:hypothetical protein